jgi:hypothetical protein
VRRSGTIPKNLDAAWLVAVTLVIATLAANDVAHWLASLRREAATAASLSAPFRHPACQPIVEAPFEALPAPAELGISSPCYFVAAVRHALHEAGRPTRLRADEFAMSYWTASRRYWAEESRLKDQALLAAPILALLYAVGAIALLRARGAGSAR